MGVSADHPATLDAFTKQNGLKHLLLGDFRRAMLPAWGAMETNEASPLYRYGRRAYFVIDRQGVVRYGRVNPIGEVPDNTPLFEVLRRLETAASKA